MNKKSGSTRQRLSLGILLAVFTTVQLFGLFAFPRQVKATGMPVFDASNFAELIKDNIGEVLYASALSSLVNGASYFMRKVAYDTAKYVASGGSGQSSLVFEKGWGSYLEDVGGNAAASAIAQFGEPFGLDLCTIPNTSLQVDLQLGLSRMYGKFSEGPEPRCTWQKFKDSWTKPESLTEFGEALLPSFNATLTVRDSDFGVALGAIAQIDRIAQKEQFAATAERQEGKGFKALKSLVSGDVKTPAAIVEKETDTLTAKNQTDLSLSQISGIYGAGAKQILPFAASVFLNTLVSEGLNTLFTKGLIPEKTATGKAGGGTADFYAQHLVSNKQAVEKAFNYLFTTVPKKQLEAYDALAELEACPDSPGLNNCVIDSKLREAISRAKFGKAITIKEALEEKLLDGAKKLISPLRIADNTNADCRLNGYCYSNLQKLRKLRVFPIGFELAALKSDPDAPWTLEQVVAGFDDCSYANNDPKTGQIVQDPKKPFCHLIDPNWIIRIPETRCENKVFGPILLDVNAPERREECADISTCITEGPNGECIDDQVYAYCTKEENVWRIGANECLPQYNTCKTFVDPKGNARSYLSRTVDYGTCDPESVGCRVYSTEKDASGWVSSQEAGANLALKNQGRNQVVHFNKNISNASCPEGAEGCNAYFQAEKQADGTYRKITSKSGGPAMAYLKKAPEYLGCYDMDKSTPGVQYPVTAADLAKVSKDPACKKFAGVCIPEEMTCQAYKPTNGGPTIPGIIGANGCAQECVGYDAFKQEATQFDHAQYPLHFVPKLGESCSLEHKDCTEFTNLTNEQLAYFTSIKYCEKPTGSNVKTFYSWEGDQANGYVLKVHKLRPIDAKDANYIQKLGLKDGAQSFLEGTPAYADDRKEELEKKYASCNADLYNKYINGLPGQEGFDPDCRAFYDEAGAVSYRLLADTITVSESCDMLRKSETSLYVDASIGDESICTGKGGKFEAGQCQRCTGGGKYQNGSCIYAAMVAPGESVSCPAEANGCREYVGNAGNNMVEVFMDDFNDKNTNIALSGWTAEGGKISASPESIQVGLGSMLVEASKVKKTITKEKLPGGNWYELSFWARGVPQLLNIEFNGNPAVAFTKNVQTGASAPVSIGNVWRLYKLGPVFLPTNDGTVSLVFSQTKSGVYYLDTVQLKKITDDKVFLIKDSWKQTVTVGGVVKSADAPLSCDPNPDDVFAGPALGCSEYTDTYGASAFAAGFEKLCREEAIGCQPLVDTFNTLAGADAEKIQVFNTLCTLPTGVATVDTNCIVKAATATLGECRVLAGESSCFVKKIVLNDINTLSGSNGVVTASTIIIPADSKISEPVFLANRPDVSCVKENLGCQRVAIEEKTMPGTAEVSYSFPTETFIKNNPENYIGPSGILCDGSQVGCTEFSQDKNKVYFKDPVVTGNQICVYRPSVTKNGNTYKGWFKLGVGQCSVGGTVDPTKLCRSGQEKADCGSETAKCVNVGEVQCYDNYLEPGGDFGIWSNKSNNYTGLVGQCPQEANLCTELVDPEDTSSKHPKGKPYYVIFDQQVKKRVDECSGGASLEEGCVLFDQTENPKKDYNTVLTYQASANKQGGLTKPEFATTKYPGNSNIVVKVDRDRQCSEWLGCRTYVTQIDENGDPQKLCYDYRACDEQSGGVCTNFKDTDIGKEYLSEQSYINRNTSWYGEEYDGYSLLNKYQMTNFEYVSIAGKPQVVYKMSQSYFTINPEDKAYGCLLDAGKAKSDWDLCGFDSKGRCYSGSCIYPIDGGFPDKVGTSTLDLAVTALGDRGQCKAFPESASPYPRSVVPFGKEDPFYAADNGNLFKRYEFPEKKPKFAEANVCQNGDCSCEYKKVTYKNGVTDFYASNQKNNALVPQGVCNGGKFDGRACTPGTTVDVEGIAVNICGEGGTCERIDTEQTFAGLRGYCLEHDFSRPINGGVDAAGNKLYACLTWLPIDVNVSGLDNYNFSPDAGYNPVVDSVGGAGESYCVQAATGLGSNSDSAMFIKNTDTGADTYSLLKQHLLNNPQAWNPETGKKHYEKLIYGAYFDDFQFDQFIKGCTVAYCGTDGDPYRFDQWLYSTLNNNLQNKFSTPSRQAATTWFVENTRPWLRYFQKMETHFSGKDGEANVNAYNYVKPISRLIADGTLEIADDVAPNSQYLLPMTKNVYRENIDIIHFGPVILPYSHDYSECIKGDGTKCLSFGARYETLYGKIFIDLNTIDKSPFEPKRITPVGAWDPGSAEKYTMYQKKGKAKENPNHTRYLIILNTDPKDGFKDVAGQIMDSYLAGGGSAPADYYYLVIYVDFDENGKLVLHNNRPFVAKHMQVAAAAGPNNFYNEEMVNNPVMASGVVLRPYCTTFKQVYTDVNLTFGESSDRAWTNRVWQGAAEPKNYGFGGFNKDFLVSLGLKAPFAPFASTKVKAQDIAVAQQYPKPMVTSFYTGVSGAGVPWKCNAPLVKGFTGYSVEGSPYKCGDASVFDQAYEQFGYANDPNTVLFDLFAKTYSTVEFENGNAAIKVTPTTAESSIAGDPINGIAPQVYSMNPARCNNKADTCIAGEANNITINGRNGTKVDYNKDGVADEDPTNIGAHEAIIAKKNFTADVQFFAFADDNRMPIKRVMVNWDDGQYTNVSVFGKYKNHKPLCATSDTEVVGLCGKPGKDGKQTTEAPTLLTCSLDTDCPVDSGMVCLTKVNTDPTKVLPGLLANTLAKRDAFNIPRFGNTPRACEDDTFKYTHAYTCSKEKEMTVKKAADSGLVSQATLNRLAALGLSGTSNICVFKPKVQALDNWGWCSGDCGGGSEVGCYSYKKAPGGIDDQCQSNKGEPWIVYKGSIIVIPK